MNIGFDIDGTLTNERFEDIHAQATNNNQALERYIVKMLDFTPSKYMRILRDALRLGDSVFIISFRWQEWEETTYQWFKSCGIQKEQIKWFFSPPELHTDSPEEYRQKVVGYKTQILQKNSIDVYYEDTDFLVEELRKTCPNTLIIHAKLAKVERR
jgi:hypothetical protein